MKSVSGLKLSLVSGYTIGIWDQLLWKWRQNPPCFGDTFLPANNMEHFLQYYSIAQWFPYTELPNSFPCNRRRLASASLENRGQNFAEARLLVLLFYSVISNRRRVSVCK